LRANIVTIEVMARPIIGFWKPLAWLALVVVAACGDSSANDGESGDQTNDGPLDAPGDGDPGDGDLGDGDPGDGDPGDGDGDGDPGDGDPGDGDPGDGDGDPPPGCGDGNLDPGEACDDGNNEPGDGCSALCQAPGQLIWEQVLDLEDQLDEIGRVVAVDVGGNIGVLVEQDAAFLIAHFDFQGVFGWSVSSLVTERPSLVVGSGGQLIAGGLLGTQGVTRAWDSTGAEVWTTIVPDGDSGILGLAIDAQNYVVAVGYHPGPNGFLARYDARGVEVLTQSQDVAGALGPVAAGPYVWALREDTDTLEIYGLDGASGWQISPLDGDVVRDLVAEDDDVYVLTEAADQSSFTVSRYDASALVWTQTRAGDGVQLSVGGLALLPGGGGLVVAGTTNLAVDSSDGLLVWFDLDGEELADEVVLDLDDVDALHDVTVTPYNYAVAVGVRRAAGADADLWIRKFEI
jgi:cysteine-rich repeat protein